MDFKSGGKTPLYMISGFLEGGKTEFIKQTISDPKFRRDDNILVLVCEEGETEYDDLEAISKVSICTVNSQNELTASALNSINEKYSPSKIICEYNGMWMLESLYSALPKSWEIYRSFFFADAGTIMQYNKNMRQLTYDKLQHCSMVLFNRLPRKADKLPYHKLVRGVSTKADIIYQYTDMTIEYDNIEDILPFDTDAEVVSIRDGDYAAWYRNIKENPKEYNGKTISFKGLVCVDQMGSDGFIVGRPLMLCCIEDVQFAGLKCVNPTAITAEDKEWYSVLADVCLSNDTDIVLTIKSMLEAKAPEPVIAAL